MACSPAESGGPSRTLTVVVDTDLPVPEALDSLRLEARPQTNPNRAVASETLVLARNTVPLPAQWVAQVPAGVSPSSPLALRITGYAQGKPTVLSEGLFLLPATGDVRVRMFLEYLCQDERSLKVDPTTHTVESACQEGTTCQGGHCEPIAIRPAEVGSVENATSSSAVEGATPACLDPGACFDGLPSSTPRRDAHGTCRVPLSEGPSTQLNVALVPSEGSPKNKSATNLVVLERGETPSTYGLDPEGLRLPQGVCDEGIARVVVSRRCPGKTASFALCGNAHGPDRKPAPVDRRYDPAPSQALPTPGPEGSSSEGGPPSPDAGSFPSSPTDGGSDPAKGDGSVSPPESDAGASRLRIRGLLMNYYDLDVELTLSNGEVLTVDGPQKTFDWSTQLPSGSRYEVTAEPKFAPDLYRCWVEGGKGVADGALVQGLLVTCGPREEVQEVATGEAFTCALLATGRVQCWGSNDPGQGPDSILGVDVDGVEQVRHVASGQHHTCVVHRDGTVRCWGTSTKGQTGGSSARSTVAGLTGAKTLVAGANHTCVLLDNGSVRCWGEGWGAVPVSMGSLSGVLSLAAGGTSTCAVLSDHTTACWEAGATRAEGVSGLSGITQMAVGRSHKCGLLESGEVRCWGDNTYGQTAGSSLAKSVPQLKEVTALASGYDHTCARLRDGSARCWGRADQNQTAASSPAVSIPGLVGVTTLATGEGHTCALTRQSRLWCWGSDQNFQASGRMGDVVPVFELPSLRNTVALAAGERHSCALMVDGTVRCWGNNEYGQTGGASLQSGVAGIASASALCAGTHHTCVVVAQGEVRCWGANDERIGGSSPTKSIEGLSGAQKVACGLSHSCAIVAGGHVRCWGSDYGGELGGSDPTTDVPGLSGAVAVAAGYQSTCVALADGSLRCWGTPRDGEPGPSSPTQSAPNLSTVKDLAMGDYMACLRSLDGQVRCWGDPRVPIPKLPTASAIAASFDVGCAASMKDGTVRCWGASTDGAQGDSEGNPIPSVHGVVELAAGHNHVLARRSDGTHVGWGSNAFGQLTGTGRFHTPYGP